MNIQTIARLVLLALVLVGCGVSQTQLEQALLQPGDLPSEFVAGQVSDGSTTVFTRSDGYVHRVVQQLDSGAQPMAYVGVAVYSDKAAQAADYLAVVRGLNDDGQPLEGLGDQSLERVNVVKFTRCTAVVVIVLPLDTGKNVRSVLQVYAERLDERLRTLVC